MSHRPIQQTDDNAMFKFNVKCAKLKTASNVQIRKFDLNKLI